MSNSHYKVRIKRRIFAIIAAVMLAITGAMPPASAGQENTGKGEFSFPMGNFISPPIALAQTPFSEAITYAPSTQLLAMTPEQMMPGKIATDKLRDLKVITTDDFEKNHLAKNREEALKKARARQDGGDLLHYMKETDLSSLPQTLKRKFSKELEAKEFKTPTPDIEPNNYWTGLKATVWEYDKKADKISDRTVELCLGFLKPFPLTNDNKTVQVRVHHIQAVR